MSMTHIDDAQDPQGGRVGHKNSRRSKERRRQGLRRESRSVHAAPSTGRTFPGNENRLEPPVRYPEYRGTHGAHTGQICVARERGRAPQEIASTLRILAAWCEHALREYCIP